MEHAESIDHSAVKEGNVAATGAPGIVLGILTQHFPGEIRRHWARTEPFALALGNDSARRVFHYRVAAGSEIIE